MLTIDRCEKHILYLTGLSVMPTAFSTLELANEAGHHLANAGPWNFWRRNGTVNLVGGQQYADTSTLPSFREMIAVQYGSGVTGWVQQADFAYIQTLRGPGSGTSDRPTFWAVEPNIAADGTVTYRLELYNTPASNGTLQAYYFGGWQEPQGGASTARVPVPDWMEGVYLAFLEAVVFGKQERDTLAMDARINQVRQSSMYLDVKDRDRAVQLNFGQMRGGAVALQQGPTYPSRWMSSSAPSI